MIVALGAGDRLITRTAYDVSPSLAHLPSIGRSLVPSVESILRYKPDLVIVDAFAEGVSLANALGRVGVRAYAAHVHGMRVAEILATIERLGTLLGLEKRADSLARSLRAEFEEIRRPVAGASAHRPTGLYVVWHSPAHVAGAASYVSELMDAAGIRNVFQDLDTPWSQVSLETIVRRDPDFLIVPSPSVEPRLLTASPGWRELRAVRENRIIVVAERLFGRPGPQFAEAARFLAGALREFEAGS
jgi:ABC-type Fe3+-hydroxamate transport system substrate-binding protein